VLRFWKNIAAVSSRYRVRGMFRINSRLLYSATRARRPRLEAVRLKPECKPLTVRYSPANGKPAAPFVSNLIWPISLCVTGKQSQTFRRERLEASALRAKFGKSKFCTFFPSVSFFFFSFCHIFLLPPNTRS